MDSASKAVSAAPDLHKQSTSTATHDQRRFPGVSLFCRMLATLEFCFVYLEGRIFGISHVIRYLRNPNPRISAKLLRSFGATVGAGTTIKRSILLDNVYEDRDSAGDFSHLIFGENCYIGDAVFFDLAAEVIFKDNAVVAGRASFVTHAECGRSSFLSSRYPRKSGAIVVGTGAWIGFGVTIMAGVNIGENSVVGSNSLVLQSTEPYGLYVGSPAHKVRTIE